MNKIPKKKWEKYIRDFLNELKYADSTDKADKQNIRYFPNKGTECFRSSLCNLLIELGDIDSAKKVDKQYPNSKLVRELITPDQEGVLDIIETRLIKELTEGKYQGTLYSSSINKEKLEANTRRKYGKRGEAILQIMNEEIKAGRLIFNKWFLLYKIFEHNRPCIVGVQAGDNNVGHVVVQRRDGKYIDNGHIKKWRLGLGLGKYLPFDILEVKAVRKESKE